MGCTSSQFVLFLVMAMQVILNVTISYEPGPSLLDKITLLALRAFVDDTTILTSDASHVHNMLARLDELMSRCRMSFEQKKSRNLPIVKDKMAAMAFFVAGQSILMVMDEPVKSLDRVYDAR